MSFNKQYRINAIHQSLEWLTDEQLDVIEALVSTMVEGRRAPPSVSVNDKYMGCPGCLWLNKVDADQCRNCQAPLRGCSVCGGLIIDGRCRCEQAIDNAVYAALHADTAAAVFAQLDVPEAPTFEAAVEEAVAEEITPLPPVPPAPPPRPGAAVTVALDGMYRGTVTGYRQGISGPEVQIEFSLCLETDKLC